MVLDVNLEGKREFFGATGILPYSVMRTMKRVDQTMYRVPLCKELGS
jgi:hypothetical protein